MGSNLQSSRSLNRQYTIPGEADNYHASHTDDSANSNKAKRSVASVAARGPILGSPPDTSSKPILSEPTSPHKTRQTQHRAPSNADPVMLEQPVLILSCKDLHTGHESHGSGIINCVCAYEDNFPARWVPHQTPVAKTTGAEAPAGMGDYDVEPLELCYQRMVGIDGQIQCYEPEESDQPDDEGLLMMKSSNTASKLEAVGPAVKKCAVDSPPRGQHEDQKYPKPFPQHIPKIHVQAVTPPDSKLFPHLAQDTITTGRPSPTPAPIAFGKSLSPVALATTNRLPQRIALATPEYTFVSHYDPFNNPSPTSIPLRDIPRGAREEVRGFTPKLESFTNWSGNPSLQSIAERVKTRVQPKVNRAYNPPHKRTTLPDTEISDSFLRGLIPSPVSVGVGLTNPGSIITKKTGHPVAESGQAAPDQGAATVTAHGFKCPAQNFIHEHFTKEVLRCRWEISQSYTQWPKLKISKGDGPALHFSEMEENYGVFLRQRL